MVKSSEVLSAKEIYDELTTCRSFSDQRRAQNLHLLRHRVSSHAPDIGNDDAGQICIDIIATILPKGYERYVTSSCIVIMTMRVVFELLERRSLSTGLADRLHVHTLSLMESWVFNLEVVDSCLKFLRLEMWPWR